MIKSTQVSTADREWLTLRSISRLTLFVSSRSMWQLCEVRG